MAETSKMHDSAINTLTEELLELRVSTFCHKRLLMYFNNPQRDMRYAIAFCVSSKYGLSTVVSSKFAECYLQAYYYRRQHKICVGISAGSMEQWWGFANTNTDCNFEITLASYRANKP